MYNAAVASAGGVTCLPSFSSCPRSVATLQAGRCNGAGVSNGCEINSQNHNILEYVWVCIMSLLREAGSLLDHCLNVSETSSCHTCHRAVGSVSLHVVAIRRNVQTQHFTSEQGCRADDSSSVQRRHQKVICSCRAPFFFNGESALPGFLVLTTNQKQEHVLESQSNAGPPRRRLHVCDTIRCSRIAYNTQSDFFSTTSNYSN